MKNISRHVRCGGRLDSLSAFLVVVFCQLTTANPLHAQWIQTNGPYGGNVYSFAVSGTNLFVGTDGGVFLSTNSGTSWTEVNSGLTNTFVRALAVSGTNLFAGTMGGGVWGRPLSEMTSVERLSTELPTRFSLGQNYPNPFNPSTTIPFSVPSKAFVSLKLFDALGREVSSLVSEELSAGTHARQWSALGLASGIYFYRLQAGNFAETRRLILPR